MYRISFFLSSPISFTVKPTFDSILAYAFVKEKFRVLPQPMSLRKDEIIDFSDLPIEKHKNGYFLASRIHYDKDKSIESCDRWRKRWDNKNDRIAHFGKGKRKRVKIDAGDFKSYDIPFLTIRTPKVWFFFESINVEEVDRIIAKHIHFLGKKRSQGFGEIRDFSIEELPSSRIVRPIPEKFFPDSTGREKQYCSWKPPYWEQLNMELCVVD